MTHDQRRTSVREQSLNGFRRFAFLMAVGGAVSGLGACGGGSSGGRDGRVEETPLALAYITEIDRQNELAPGAVYQFTINADGSLAPLSNASVATGAVPTSVVSDPSGHYVYVTNLLDATISQYAVGQGGGLTPLLPDAVRIGGPFPFAAGYSATVDPGNRFLYVVITPRDPPGPTAAIAQYSIGTDGKLTPLSTAYVEVNASALGSLAIDASGQHAYLAGSTQTGGDQVFQFSISTDGTLSPLTQASVVVARTAVGVVIAPGGRTAYVLSTCVDTECNGQVAQYTVGTDGQLTSTGVNTLTGGHVNPVSMLTNESGSAAYLLTNLMGVDTNAGAVYQYALDTTGALAPDTTPSLSVKSGSVAQSIHGSYVYALSSNALGFASGAPSGGNLDQYAMDPGGLLTTVGTMPLGGGSPTGMTILVPH